MVEANLDHLGEKLLIAVEIGNGVAAHADDGRLHFGWRIEDMLVDGKEVFDIVEGRKQDTQNAIGFAARSGTHPLGDLFLEHAHQLGDAVAVVVDAEKDLRRNVIGEIAYDRKGIGKKGGEVELEEVALDNMERGIVAVEIVDRLAVDFDGVEIEFGFVQQIFSHNAHPRSDFEHMGYRTREAVGNLSGYILVLEKMLT